jgi:hypothetical protein
MGAVPGCSDLKSVCGGGLEVEAGGDAGSAFAAALGVFVALEPAVDAGLVDSALLHVEDDFGAGVGDAAVVDYFVEVAVDEAHGTVGSLA